MVETVASDTADQAFNMRILPRRAWRRNDFFNVHVLDALALGLAVDRVTISKQQPRHLVIRKGFDDLLGLPVCGWMRRYVEVDDHATMMS